MADISSQPEKQIEQMPPKVEGAAEANAKIAGAKDASQGTSSAKSIADHDELKISTAGQDQSKAGQLERKIGQASDVNDKSESFAEPERQIIGNPQHDVQFHHYQKGDTCATAAQEGIIHKHTGSDPGLDALKDEADKKGWTRENGKTPPDNVGNLLDAHGIPTERWKDGSATMDTLEKELAQKHDAIAGVDAGELYQQESYLGRGHAVWVTGLEKDAGGKITKVYVNDSNNPPPNEYDADHFQRAWDGSHRLMVSTRHAAPKM